MGVIINYAAERTTSVNTGLRFSLLPLGSRVPTTYTVTAAAAGTSVNLAVNANVAAGATSITLTSAPSATIPALSKIVFANGVTVRTTSATSTTTMAIQAAAAAIPSGTTGAYTAGALTSGSMYLSVSPTPVALYPGENLIFNPGASQTIATVTDYAPAGVSTIDVLPLPGTITAAQTAVTTATLYIAGATDASPTSNPKLVDASNFLSGAGQEQVITGTNRTLNFSFQRIKGDPGADLLMQILYNDAYYNREIYAVLERATGEKYEGAAIPVSGDQSSPVQDLVTVSCNLQFQGLSFKYTPAVGSFNPGTGAYTPPVGV